MRAATRYAVIRFLLKAGVLSVVSLLRWREGAWQVAALLFLCASILDIALAVMRRHPLSHIQVAYGLEAAAFLGLSGIATAMSIISSP